MTGARAARTRTVSKAPPSNVVPFSKANPAPDAEAPKPAPRKTRRRAALVPETDPPESSTAPPPTGEPEAEETAPAPDIEAVFLGLNDTGNGRRLVRAHSEDFRYVEALGGWHTWDGKRWSLDVKDVQMHRWAKEIEVEIRGDAQRIVDEKARIRFLSWANSSASARGVSSAVAMARSEPGVVVDSDRFDANPRLLAVSNGVVELTDTGAVFREGHSREDYITRFTRGAYNPRAKPRRFLAWLQRIQPDPEMRAWLQRLAGYSVLGGNPERQFIVPYGPTSTGKTTFVEIVGSALGEYANTYNLSLFRVKQDESPRADLVHAFYRRFLYTAEASPAWALHADQIKRSVGNDTMSARLPHKGEEITKVPDYTPWMATNALPDFHGADNALKVRLLFVPFLSAIAKDDQDEGFRESLLRAEADGILTWIVNGWTAYRTATDDKGIRLGIKTIPASALEANMAALDNLSHIDRFLAECCQRDASYSVDHRSVWAAYKAWCEYADVTKQDGRLSENPFSSALTGLGIEKQLERFEGGQGNKRPFRRGIRLSRAGEGFATNRWRLTDTAEGEK